MKKTIIIVAVIVLIVWVVYCLGPDICYYFNRINTSEEEIIRNRKRYNEIIDRSNKGARLSDKEWEERDSLDNWFEKRHWENDDGHDPPTKWEEWQAILK